ncbi:hypothetical protein BRARA_A01233 [Brassica rapa]|uniref:DUF1985 domain-containing protein n=1 Tax=Brassica campestris TaxID=3711 RepID=A0A398AL01_BRACM|nr:hypothetical protein BRARA_A01233 [Brassica rapa]
MEELGLPERLFETGYEPTGRKRINNYFNLRWIEVVKTALSDAQQEMLAESQFRQLMLMGSHTFSVMFAHQLLSRQLVTRKLYELWWVFAGKPIRYGIGEFALVTGLNCGTPPTASVAEQRVAKGKKKGKSKAKQCGGDGHVWQSLFGSEETITADWIICRLGQKDKYKDDDTRLRLSLLLLVEAILCPTSGSTQLRPDVVEMVGDIPMFLQYPWGRESFLLTVGSGKIRSAGQLVQDTLAIQGFAHAMVLVTVCSCPQIIASPGLGEDLLNEDLPIEDIVDESAILSFADEVDDVQVNHLVSLIHDGFPFEINTWRGGVKAADAKHSKGAAGGLCPDQGNVQGQSTAHANAECNAGGCDFGERFDVSNFVRLVANELHTRAVPLLRTLKAELIGEIQSVKFEVLASLGGVMEGPRGGNAHRVPEVPFTSSAGTGL